MATADQFDHIDPTTSEPRVVRTVVEIPKGRRSKFELDDETGLFKLDRYLYSSNHYPGDYGFLPRTLAEDGDSLDVLVMVNEPTFTGCLIETRVVGLFRMIDRGHPDYKVLGVPAEDPLFAEYVDLDSVPSHFLREVEHFFQTYKQLEGGTVEIEAEGWGSAEDALEEIAASVRRYEAR